MISLVSCGTDGVLARHSGAINPVQDSSPLFIYSPPGAWIDTPLKLNDSPSLVRHISYTDLPVAEQFSTLTIELSHIIPLMSKTQRSRLTSSALESISSLLLSPPQAPTIFTSTARASRTGGTRAQTRIGNYSSDLSPGSKWRLIPSLSSTLE